MLNDLNNETIGISCEVAIADAFEVEISNEYRGRSDKELVEKLKGSIKDIFKKNNIPKPIKHIAEGQNPIDFELEGGFSLSVKSNKKALGKVAPQKIGQPTDKTFFVYFAEYTDDFDSKEIFEKCTNDERRKAFKEFILKHTKLAIEHYWKNLFDTDYYIHFYNMNIDYIVLNHLKLIDFDESKFTFTKSLSTWNESNTIKYNGLSIGEFQVHNNRNCFKFRFNIKNLLTLIEL